MNSPTVNIQRSIRSAKTVVSGHNYRSCTQGEAASSEEGVTLGCDVPCSGATFSNNLSNCDRPGLTSPSKRFSCRDSYSASAYLPRRRVGLANRRIRINRNVSHDCRCKCGHGSGRPAKHDIITRSPGPRKRSASTRAPKGTRPSSCCSGLVPIHSSRLRFLRNQRRGDRGAGNQCGAGEGIRTDQTRGGQEPGDRRRFAHSGESLQ